MVWLDVSLSLEAILVPSVVAFSMRVPVGLTLIGYAFFLLICSTVSENFTCYETQGDLAKACSEMYMGIIDGGQCFFVGGLANGWPEGWAACVSRGAKLAQLHTGSEYKKVSTHLQSYVPTKYGYDGQYTAALIALRDLNDSALDNSTVAIKPDATFWFEDESRPLVNAGNTYIRTHVGDDRAGTDHAIAPPRCFYLHNWFTRVIDYPCNSPSVVLCQLTSVSQNYTKTNTCLAENPIETSTADIPQDCANSCSQRPWCRSFNFVTHNDTHCLRECQLFSWSIYDDCPNCANRTDTSPACVHYNYVP